MAQLHPGRRLRQSIDDTGTTGWIFAICEALGWSVVIRLLLVVVKTRNTLRLLDRFPFWHLGSGGIPTLRWFRPAGACLGQSIARSQYLRQRHIPHAIVVGVRGTWDTFGAHAWVDILEEAPAEFEEIWRVQRGVV